MFAQGLGPSQCSIIGSHYYGHFKYCHHSPSQLEGLQDAGNGCPVPSWGNWERRGHFPTFPSPSPGGRGLPLATDRQFLCLLTHSQLPLIQTGKQSRPAGVPRHPPPTPRTAKGQPSSEGEVPQALGTGSKAGAPDKTPGRERSRLSSGLLLTTPLQIAIGRWEEGASPQDEKAACWVTVLTGHHPYLHKGQPQSLVWE